MQRGLAVTWERTGGPQDPGAGTDLVLACRSTEPGHAHLIIAAFPAVTIGAGLWPQPIEVREAGATAETGA